LRCIWGPFASGDEPNRPLAFICRLPGAKRLERCYVDRTSRSTGQWPCARKPSRIARAALLATSCCP
jgi:hypothetical protein